MDYKNVFPIEKQCTWDEIGKFYPSQYLRFVVSNTLLSDFSILALRRLQQEDSLCSSII